MPGKEKKLKDAFTKVKKDIFNLQSQLLSISREIQLLKRTLTPTDKPTDTQNSNKTSADTPTQEHKIQTNTLQVQTNTLKEHLPEAFKPKDFKVSIGNEGVPTDRQTNQQTDRQTHKFAQLNTFLSDKEDKITQIARVSEILGSLDTLKKDIRSIFKKLTPQEMLIYSTIYQLSDQGFTIDYPLLASKTSLTESSIRDYVLKLQKKGVPLAKTKENNKKVVLSIPQDFKKITSLSTIFSLRKL